jgi:general secretion pathway protein F
MPMYEYTALDFQGRKRKGVIDAASFVAARQKLREMDIFPVDVREVLSSDGGQNVRLGSSGSFFKKVGMREVAVITRQLATLLAAGLPLVPSLAVLIKQAHHPQLKIALARIRDEVNEGGSFTASLANFPQIFPAFYVNMVRAGEASGNLDLVLERLSDFSEAQQALQIKIRSAMAYPIFMFFIGSIVLLFLLTFIVPNITKIFAEMHQALPPITVLLIAVSTFLQSFWWVIIIVIIAAVVGVRYAIRNTETGSYAWDRLKLRAPLFGRVNLKIAIARFSRTLGTLLQSGVPLLTAMEIVKHVVNNCLIAEEIEKAGKDVEEGQSLSIPLSRSGLFPPVVIEMLSVGEQSGNIEPMLYRIADSYDKEAEADILMMTSLLEPAMILFMGLIVGFIVVSILLPIFEMNQLVR